MPSPSESANDRGYTWYTTARVHHGASSTVQLTCPIVAPAVEFRLRGLLS